MTRTAGPMRRDQGRRLALSGTIALGVVSILVLSSVLGLAGAAAPPAVAPAQGSPLNFAMIWHMHQPLYKNILTGKYEMPWVRDHAPEEYLDHPKILMEHPEVNATFNLVPSLILQIEDYAAGAIDNHIELARIDLATATPDERRMMAQEFIRLAPWHYTRNTSDGRILNPWYDTYAAWPRLNVLVQKVSVDPSSLTDTELQDLETIFFLHQISIPFIEGQYDAVERNDAILALLQKGTGYTQADTEAVLAAERDIMSRVVGFYRAAQDSGQAEVITTPFYHPIVPLLMDPMVPSEDGLHNITKGAWDEDARYQYANATLFYEARFGRAPAGVWHSEQSVSPTLIADAAGAGFGWTSSDEGVLWKSEVGGVLVAEDLVNLTRVYTATETGQSMDLVFRSTEISNRVSFDYGGQPTDQAVQDFMAFLQAAHDGLTDAQRASGLLTLAADGENWMFMAGYPNDGRDFLNALYENLTAAQAAGWLRTWKVGEFVSQPGLAKVALSRLHAGSWIDADFRTWGGEEEEQVGWARLVAARQAVAAYTLSAEGQSFLQPTSGPAVRRAWEAIFTAEGSDWFWWYGDDQSSGDDGRFDSNFKAHLITAYTTIGQEPPLDLTMPWGPAATPTQPGAVAEDSPPPTVDGTVGASEWTNATGWTQAASGELLRLRGFYAFAGASSLYLRVDLNGDAHALRGTSGRDVEVYISNPVRIAERDLEVNLNRYGVNFASRNGDYLFEWAARYRLRVVFAQSLSTGVTPWSLFTAHEGPTYLGDGTWTFRSGKDDGVSVGSVIEILLPLSEIGAGPGDRLRLAVVTSNGTADVDILPAIAAGAGEITVLIPRPGPPIAIFEDPVGDDLGDGDYTYATSADFRCKDGSHCEDLLYDLAFFNISDAPTSVTFTIGFVDIGQNPWNGPNGFAYQIVNVYIDVDRVPGSGNLLMLEGANARVASDYAWEAAVQAAGWSDARTFVTRDPSVTQRLQSGLLVRRAPGTQNIEVTVPKALLPSGDPKAWGYVVVAGGQDGFGPGWWRPISSVAATWVGGGAGRPGVPPGFHPRIYDAITGAADQSAALATYTTSAVATVPGVVIEVKAPGLPAVTVNPAVPWQVDDVIQLSWSAQPNPETNRPIQSYDVTIQYGPGDLIADLRGTTQSGTSFTVTKEQNVTIRATAFDGFATSAPFVEEYEVVQSPPPPPQNRAPVLLESSVDPAQGDERTVFLFHVRYLDPDGDAPAVEVVLDGAPMPLQYVGGANDTGAVFRAALTLAAGSHTYRFTADDRNGSTVQSAEFTLVVAPGPSNVLVLASAGGIGVAAAAVVGILILRARRPRKGAEPEAPKEEPPSEGPDEPGGP